MITSEAQLAAAQADAERLAIADWELHLKLYTSPEDRSQRGIEHTVIRRKLARLEADIAEYVANRP